MKKKTKAKSQKAKATSQEQFLAEEIEEMKQLRSQNLSLQELHNLKDNAYYRMQVLNNLNRIAQAIENLELSEDEESKEESEEEESEEG